MLLSISLTLLLYNFSKSQLLEIGLGLESSKASFIWVIRDSYGDAFFPEGFEERVRDRAFVIKGWGSTGSIS
ncbi:hypothetical protein SO802_030501 [Lithocarpus litseifolius]|uniref:Uncharacterized protein n=1 Tax=Lithocarpus litseifolius TaxID=425828 RepID=A0AAW2BHQ0_9ROSI